MTSTGEPDSGGGEFEEERTSPQVVRVPRARATWTAGSTDPVAIVAAADPDKRRHIVELLWTDGWNAVEAGHAEELVTLCRRHSPEVVLVDSAMQLGGVMSIPEAVHAARHGASTRVIGLLQPGASMNESIAAAFADDYDDFITDPGNDVELLARSAANLRNARTRDELHKQRRDSALLLELVQTLASSLDMTHILYMVSRLVAEVISLERCSIVLIDPNGDEAVMVAASEDRTVRDLRIKLANYPEVQRCIASGAPVLIEDATTDPLLAAVQKSVVEKSIRTMALFPVVFDERVTGVLFLRSSKAARRLSEVDVQFGQTVASTCAVAIRNARLFDQFRSETERINSMRVIAERQSEALRKYQDFFEYAADGMAIIDLDGRVLYMNKEGRRLFGLATGDVSELRFQELIIEESRARWHEVVEQVRHGRFKRSFDVYARRADSRERVFSFSAGGGGPEAGLIIVSFRDVTETREMEGELRTTKEFLENLIDNSVDAIVAADMHGNIMLFNKGAERIWGYVAEDVIGKMKLEDLYPSGVAPDVMTHLRDDRWGGRGRLEAHRREIVTPAGDVVPVSMTASIIYEDEEEVATVGVFTDLRDRMAMERQLSEAQDQLTKTEKARVAAELAGMAAHELNQPLTSVLGYADMLKNRIPEEDARLRRPVDTIFKQAERMAEIVRKIGRITKYETTRYGLNTDMIDLDRATSTGDAAGGPAEAAGGPAPAAALSGVPGSAVGAGQAMGPGAAAPTTVGFGAVAAATAAPPSSSGGKAFLRALASVPGRSAGPASGQDPRAAVVRMDTVDPKPVGYERRLREQEKNRQGKAEKPDGEVTSPGGWAPSTPAAGTPARASRPSTSSQPPMPRSPFMTQVPESSSFDDATSDTNPGVKLSDLKKP